jgi:hypothetical protein
MYEALRVCTCIVSCASRAGSKQTLTHNSGPNTHVVEVQAHPLNHSRYEVLSLMACVAPKDYKM